MSAGCVLTFSADGKGRGLYTEAVDLSRIGRLSIRRATRIEFDNAAGEWKVYLPDSDEALYSSPSRSGCIGWEHRYIEKRENICNAYTE